MSDEDAQVTIQPAIPSRAAHHQTPEALMANRPAFLDQPSPGTEKPKRKRRQSPPKHSRQKIAPTKIKRIRANRRKNVKKVKKAKRTPQPLSKTINQGRPKNPNRPLELKNQLHTVLMLVAGLPKNEVSTFTAAMGQLGNLSRSGRKRVLDALRQVYG
jgi:hypothetical protein